MKKKLNNIQLKTYNMLLKYNIPEDTINDIVYNKHNNKKITLKIKNNQLIEIKEVKTL